MSGYYHAKRTAIAKAYLNDSEAQERAKRKLQQNEARLNHWRAWLQYHLAQPRKTQIDWRPRYAMTPPEEFDDGKGKEGFVADIGPASGEREESTQGEGIAESGGYPAPIGAESSGGWAEEAYPQPNHEGGVEEAQGDEGVR